MSATSIERCTGIPHNLQHELLPNIAVRTGESAALELLARDAMRAVSEDQLDAVYAAISLWSSASSDIPRNDAPVGHAISLRDVTTHADALRSVSVTKRINSADLRSGMVGRAEMPAPTESSLSVALRFLASNAFSLKQGEEAIGMRLQQSPGPHWRPAIVAFDEELTAREWSETLDQRLSFELPYTVGLLLPDNFRFCRHCLEDQFHSTFHQLATADTCLLHATPILEVCVHCASPVGTIESVLQKGYKAYVCGRCKKLIYGNASSYRSHLEFRQSLASSGERFQQSMDWLSQAQARLWPVEQLIRQNRNSAYDWGQWGCDRKRLVDSFHPLPSARTTVLRQPLYALPWSLRLAAGEDVAGSTEANSNSWMQTSGSVYLSALRSIASFANDGHMYDDASFTDLDLNSIIRTEREQLKSMAFVFVRMFCERPRNFSHEWESLAVDDVRHKFSRLSTLGGMQRLPVKAVILAYYNIVLSAMTMQRCEPLQRSRLRWLTPDQVVPFARLPEATEPASQLFYSEGVVVSPAAENFPIERLYPGSRSLG
ncbi:hypothetical protein [Paraburkholderia sp. BL6665CI2N2]|uniref:hypothetical protein n=1 Tax=Paraburkholderia sp. BL6665CI2N2 TaxID=1938806 RepID=UPI0010662B1F|nr:hypothetical protein [Paraburkholderia sp. BL6665CI2N2]